jgi:hypothetical protein
MRKKILMIGNTTRLRGVSIDIYTYYDFFTSPVGGNWCHEEIDILRNPMRSSLFKKLDEIERTGYDYVITIFSGHGKEMGSGTVLGINGQKEKIAMSDLTNLSQRQLLIFDCCRVHVDCDFTEEKPTMLSMSRAPIRQAYEDRIEDSPPQEVILFACAEGESAFDSEDGGRYSQCLLYAAQMVSTNSDSPFVSVSTVHHQAAALMKQDSLTDQHPQILQSRCPPSCRLPLAVNPNFF